MLVANNQTIKAWQRYLKIASITPDPKSDPESESLDKLGTASDRCGLANWNNTDPVDVTMDKKTTVMIGTPDPGTRIITNH